MAYLACLVKILPLFAVPPGPFQKTSTELGQNLLFFIVGMAAAGRFNKTSPEPGQKI